MYYKSLNTIRLLFIEQVNDTDDTIKYSQKEKVETVHMILRTYGQVQCRYNDVCEKWLEEQRHQCINAKDQGKTVILQLFRNGRTIKQMLHKQHKKKLELLLFKKKTRKHLVEKSIFPQFFFRPFKRAFLYNTSLLLLFIFVHVIAFA